MLSISIPGRDKLEIKNIVLDFNGTIATDGKLNPAVKEKLDQFKAYLKIYVLTSDTFSTVENELKDLNIHLCIFKSNEVSTEKWRFVRSIGASGTICIGNGVNDIGMFSISALSILVIGTEGCSAKAISKADIVVKSVEDALDMISNAKRIAATLRE